MATTQPFRPTNGRDNQNRQKGSIAVPVFSTPGPITVTIDLAAADLRVIATERDDTSVEVRPRNPSRAGDVKAAEQTRVEYANGRLLVKGPRQRFRFGRSDELDVTIALPAGSSVFGSGAMGELYAEGRLGECRFFSGMGNITLDEVHRPNVNSGYGNITIERAVGHTDITTGSGLLRIREIQGSAKITNSDGETIIGEVSGDLRVDEAVGNVSVGRVLGSLVAKISYGDIRIGEVVRSSVILETGYGNVEVGIRAGTAAWLDLSTEYGRVRNSLQASDGPDQAEETVEVRARTDYGDITIKRAN